MNLSWEDIVEKFEEVIGKKPDSLEVVLFVIGLNKLGQGKKSYSKEQKQDIIHIGMCEVLSLENIYVFDKTDKEGWPHYKLLQPMPSMTKPEQESFLKNVIIQYCQQELSLF